MEMLEVSLDFGKKPTTRLMYGTCSHIGNPNHDDKAQALFIERAKKMPWWHAGDLIESIPPVDKRFNVNEHKATVMETIDEAACVLRPAAKTCLGIIMGNHEWKLSALVGDVTAKIAKDVGTQNFGACAYVDFMCPKGSSRSLLHHGSGSMGHNSGNPERDEANREIKLRRKVNRFEFDVFCCGHYHRTIVAPPISKGMGKVIDGKFKRSASIHSREWVMACPSLFRNYESGPGASYAEIGLMPPTDIGWLELIMDRSGQLLAVEEIGGDGKCMSVTEPRYLR